MGHGIFQAAHYTNQLDNHGHRLLVWRAIPYPTVISNARGAVNAVSLYNSYFLENFYNFRIII